MFLTNEKKKHSTWQGTFYTRKWNDQTPVVYFEKLYGGRPLLKKVNHLHYRIISSLTLLWLMRIIQQFGSQLDGRF